MTTKKKEEKIAGNSAVAVFETGSKQYKVSLGDKIKVEKLDAKVGDKIDFKNVILLNNTKETKIGAPLVSGAKIVAEVLTQARHAKVSLLKYKAKERQRVFKGHKQPYTELKIVEIVEK